MRAWGKLTWVEAKLFLREPIGAFFALVFPVMLLLLFGSIYGNDPAEIFGGYGTVDVMVPSYAGMIIGTTGIMSLTIAMAAYREQGILRRFRTTTMRPLTLLIAQTVVLFAVNVVGLLILVVVGRLVYGLHFLGNPVTMLLALLLSSVAFFALGFVLAGLAPTARTAQIVAMVLFYPMIFLSGTGIPREIMPAAVQRFSEYLPLTHVVTLLRGLWLGDAWSQHLREIYILLGMAVVGLAVSAKTFRWE